MPKTMKLGLKKSAPDEIRVRFGMEYDRTFKSSDAPFQVDRNIGEAILRSYDEFTEMPEKTPRKRKSSAKPKAKTAVKKTASKTVVKTAAKTTAPAKDVPADTSAPKTEDSPNQAAAAKTDVQEAENTGK